MTTEAQITAWLATQQEAMIAELKEMTRRAWIALASR
jgi:hypothetical protein